MNFDSAFERLLGHEGGYVADSRDPGGETKYGISRRAYPGEDIKGMTLERAKFLYQRDYWGPAGCDAVPAEVKFDLFDVAVNSGVTRAIKLLQECCGEVQDGKLGPRTLQAISSMHPLRVAARFAGARLKFMADLPTWDTFGRGWARRVAANLRAL